MTETGEQDIDGNKEGQNDDYYGFLPFTLLPWNRREVSSTEITTIEISWDRSDGEYFFGEDATIRASYGNHSVVLKIYWMRKIDSVDHVERIDTKLQKYTGSTYSNMVEKPMLLIKNCDESDIGTYHLLVMCKNHLPIYSKNIDLKVVKGPPRVAINPVPLALQNELVEIKATIRCFPKCQSVIWMKNDQLINTTDPKYDVNNCEFPVLCIKKVTERDNGVYKVIARNELGEGESSEDLEVIGESEMLFISGPVVVSPLKRITFQAYLPGREKMNAKWWKIKDHTKEELKVDNQKYHIYHQSNDIVCFEIFWADQEDSAAYQLSLGKRRSNRINVCVDDSGTFSTTKQGNRLRLFELQSVSADAMRIVFDSMPGSFANKIKTYCNLSPNSKRTNDLLSDLQTGTKSSSKNLDITLMYSIIRNLWKGAIPQNGWGKDPMGNHIETADDIERIRHYRHFICHSDDSGIDTNVFNFSFLDLSRAIGRLSSNNSDLIKASWEIMNRVSTKGEYLQEMIEKIVKEKKLDETPLNEDTPSPLSFLQDDARDDGPMHRASPSPSNKDISYQSSSVNENMDEDPRPRTSPSSSNKDDNRDEGPSPRTSPASDKKDRFSSQSLFLHENRDEAPRHRASPSMTNQETYRFEPIQSEKLKELLNSFKVEFPDDLSSESFIHQILQDDMLKTLVTAVKSLSKGIMLTKNINERRHDMPNVGACVFEVDVVFDGDQFSVIRKNASSNDFFNVNEEYLTRVILIKSKSLPVVDAKLLVYKKYKHVINRRKIVLQHEYEEFDDVAKCIAYQILSSFCTFVESVINAFTMDLHTIISDYPVESLTVEKIKRLCKEVFERIEDETIGAFESKSDWRRWVADEIGRIIRRKGEPVCSDAWVEIKNISQKTVKDLNAILTELEEFQTCVLPVDQNKQVEEWLKRDVILDKSVFKMHPSIIKYITGYKDRDDKKRVVKVYLHGDDKKAENFFKECCKISTDTYFEFVNVERSKGGNKEVEELKQRERKAPVVDNSTRKQLKQIIQEYGDKIYARHSNVVGIRIGKARRVGDTIQEQPCLVLYCLDKFLVPFGEKPLPEAIAGWPCDIREDFVRFGICPDRCLASSQNLPDPGCSIGIPSHDSSGSVGFLIESKDPLHTFEFGFLTASHVAVKRFEQLYHDEKLLSMHSLKLNDHFIVHPSWIDNGRNDHRIGKVVESFCGNYGLNKIGLDFAVIASSYCRNGAGKETLKVAKEEDLIMEKDIVTKTGRTTGTTKGCLMEDSLTVKVDFSRGYFAFFNCYAIEDIPDHRPFFREGDSGSGVYVMENGKPSKPLGIAFAYLDSQTAVCNIGMIVDKLDLQIVRYRENRYSLKTFEELKISDEKTEEKSQEPMEES